MLVKLKAFYEEWMQAKKENRKPKRKKVKLDFI